MGYRQPVLACLLALGMPGLAIAQANVAFVGFNVVPMTRDTVLRNHTVLVANGRITAVGPSRSVRVPAGAVRISGSADQFIVPALADMHTHTTNPQELALFASHGVLTVLNLGWSSDDFVATERHRYGSGELFGPTVLEGRLMNWPYGRRPGIANVTQARDTVQHAKRIGYDFIKVYSFLADSVFEAIMSESRAQQIPVVGHYTNGIGLPRALNSGLRMIVHAEELRQAIGVPIRQTAADSVIRLFREHNTWLTPTLSTFEAITNVWGNPSRLQEYIDEGQRERVPLMTTESWRRTNYHTQAGTSTDRLNAYTEITRQLHNAGVPLLAGTDGTVVPGMIPGIAIHRELQLMQSIGMSAYEALATATSNPGRFIAETVPGAAAFGTIAVGARADFLIVGSNPRDSLGVLRTPKSVVRHGRVFTAAQLDSIRSGNNRRSGN